MIKEKKTEEEEEEEGEGNETNDGMNSRTEIA